jgi:hypothetical protein
MITSNLVGGLGNNMFQIATAVAMALQNRMPFGFCETQIGDNPFKVETVYPSCMFQDLEVWNEDINGLFQMRVLPFRDNIKLNGFFQDEMYFINYREFLQDVIFRVERTRNKNIAVHVRRGDYLQYPTKHPIPTMDGYYIPCMERFCSGEFGDKNPKFTVFSDDIDWCAENFPTNRFDIEFSEGNTAVEDLYAMAKCKHFVIANSSFSWWAAWLSRSENKIVFTPDPWFGTDNSNLQWEIVPQNWIKVKY